VGVVYTQHIMDSTLNTTLDTLRVQREQVESEVDGLRTALAGAEQRLSYTRGAIENIEALIGLSEPETGRVVDASAEVESPLSRDLVDAEVPVGELQERHVPDPGSRFFPTAPQSRTRNPTTGQLAEVVNEAGRVMTRDEVFEVYAERFGIPESWANPRNSLGNAINRAADRKWIRRLDPNHFAPRDYELLGAQDQLTHGGQ